MFQPMQNNSIVEFENVQIGYDKRPLLNRVIDISILREEFWGIVGPNGGGKSTFLKTVLGLLPPISGNVHYEYNPVFGYVPQFSTFDDIYPFSSVNLFIFFIILFSSSIAKIKKRTSHTKNPTPNEKISIILVYLQIIYKKKFHRK